MIPTWKDKSVFLALQIRLQLPEIAWPSDMINQPNVLSSRLSLMFHCTFKEGGPL